MSESRWTTDEAASRDGGPGDWPRALEEFCQAVIDGTLPRPAPGPPFLIVGPKVYAIIEERAAEHGMTADEYVSHLIAGTLTLPAKDGIHISRRTASP